MVEILAMVSPELQIQAEAVGEQVLPELAALVVQV
jgi:hypothetical protein